MSIIDRLAATKFLGDCRLKEWVDIFKHVEDNQLPIVDPLAASNLFAKDLENGRVVNGCGEVSSKDNM